LHSLELGVLARQEDPTFAKTESEFPYDINLLVVNADQVLPTYEHLGGEVFGGRYNIGLWFWEQELFPRRWWPAFDVLHEVWAASSFAADALSAVSPLPVRRVPLPVESQTPMEVDRSRWGVPEDCYLFFFMFNYLSHFERKNPLALVRAFRLAFGSPDSGSPDSGSPDRSLRQTSSGKRPHLLIKTSHADYAPEEHALLEQACAGENIHLLDGYLDREEISALNGMSDCYVSLHRSEGFGLTLAEAMGLGKPVIATPYSGVTDFFDLNTGYPVRYDLIRLSEDVGPYPAGSHWADPDEEDAARRMRHVFEHQEEARLRGKAGQKKVMESLSHAAVGALLRRRFDELVERVNRSLLP
jgi:glycosyltransferase involved in cell wall biosynthesis